MDLDRYTELANKVLENNNPEQKHKVLSNLIDEISNYLPDVITQQHRELLMSNTTLRFSNYWSDVLHPYGKSNIFHGCVSLLTKYRDEVEQFERDDEATIAMRKAKLKQYAQTERIEMPSQIKGYKSDGNPIYERPKHPDAIYCENGAYRKFDQIKDSFYYRLGRMIQNTHADNGDLKKTMKEVCLIVALNNERSIVEDELRLLGIMPMGKTDTNDKRAVCLQSIVEHINKKMSSDLHKSVADVVILIGNQIRLYINSIGTVEYLNYIEQHISTHHKLNIYGSGNPILDKTKEGNLFFAIDYLRKEFEELSPNDRFGDSYYYICDKYAKFITAMNYSTIYRVGENPEIIYYNLWDNLLQPENVLPHGWYIENLAKARFNPDQNLHVTSIQVNNDYFVEHLESWKELKKGWSFYVDELQFMMEDYAKRKSIVCADDIVSIKLDWLYNTLNLCDNEYKMVQRWCDEQIAMLKSNGEINKPEQPTPSIVAVEGEQLETSTHNFSHMESFKPTIKFDMLALYSFLKDQGVVVDIKYSLFCDCISHAHINELWNSNHVVKKRKRNLLQCLFKMLAQEYYPEEWIARCAKNLNKDKKKITNPTTSGATVEFEDKLRDILKGKTIK